MYNRIVHSFYQIDYLIELLELRGTKKRAGKRVKFTNFFGLVTHRGQTSQCKPWTIFTWSLKPIAPYHTYGPYIFPFLIKFYPYVELNEYLTMHITLQNFDHETWKTLRHGNRHESKTSTIVMFPFPTRGLHTLTAITHINHQAGTLFMSSNVTTPFCKTTDTNLCNVI